MNKRKTEEKIPLTEKRLLNIGEFCQYTGLGRNRARLLVDESGCLLHIGRRLLIDRPKFDRWCDQR